MESYYDLIYPNGERDVGGEESSLATCKSMLLHQNSTYVDHKTLACESLLRSLHLCLRVVSAPQTPIF